MDHLLDDEELPRHERELTLSTGAILGIFLGLAVLCGGFFGLGYNMGRKSAPTPLNLSDINTDASQGLPNTASKPPAGTPMAENSPELTAPVAPVKPARKPPATVATSLGGSDSGATAEEIPPAKPPRTPPSASSATATTPAPVVRQPAPVLPSALNPSIPPPPSATATTTTTSGGTYMVQVAAVSHQEDASLLVGALRARGYAVSARSAATDSFIHVQVGPFHDKKEADAMRQRLLTDGYNAIVK